jgi:hypothetical protein
MAKGLAGGGVVRSRRETEERCLALSGKGAPAPAELEEAIEVVARAARALGDARLRGAHAFEPGAPEVRLRAPTPGARGGTGWTVFVRVPPWVDEREARLAAAAAAGRSPAARSIRLSPVEVEPARRRTAPGRDRQPGQLRRRQVGPQHRARELR